MINKVSMPVFKWRNSSRPRGWSKKKLFFQVAQWRKRISGCSEEGTRQGWRDKKANKRNGTLNKRRTKVQDVEKALQNISDKYLERKHRSFFSPSLPRSQRPLFKHSS